MSIDYAFHFSDIDLGGPTVSSASLYDSCAKKCTYLGMNDTALFAFFDFLAEEGIQNPIWELASPDDAVRCETQGLIEYFETVLAKLDDSTLHKKQLNPEVAANILMSINNMIAKLKANSSSKYCYVLMA